MKTTYKDKDLVPMGIVKGKAKGTALRLLNTFFKEIPKAEGLAKIQDVVNAPHTFVQDSIFAPFAAHFIEEIRENTVIELGEEKAFPMYGEEFIEEGAKKQLEIAMRLPVAVAGALMPDAHQGYGLPIGGVLATKNAIIPYGVGVDIGCRMALSIYDISEEYFLENHAIFKRELIARTVFGAGNGFRGKYRSEHEVLDRSEFQATPFIKNLKDKAYSQLGSSGGGNHFVEFGIVEFEQNDTELGIAKGRYVALLTHSGSRGFGATIAGSYTRLAKELCKLPKEAANLAYFDLDSAEGQEYWLAMNLAGDYASACHEVIHTKMQSALGASVLAKVENHHNFAWKEQFNGEEVIVHRKGATPAAKGVLGFIPGSMTAPGFLVRGKGKESALNSASHGAGRQFSRTRAIEMFSRKQVQEILTKQGVTLIGGGLDEAPMAYKDIHTVMNAQRSLVDVLATFTPKIVRMADDGSRED